MIGKVDETGRIALPAEYLKALHIRAKDALEINVDADRIVIKKVVVGCRFCGAAAKLVKIGNECVCRSCIERLQNASEGEMLYLQEMG